MSLAGRKARRSRSGRFVASLLPTLACAFAAVSVWTAAPAAGRAAGSPSELYFYPASLRLADGTESGDLMTLAPEQITTLFPAIPQMAGVVMLVNWSTLCPSGQACDFSIIDKALAYWGARGKKVVLGVATVGIPVKALINGRARFISATPEWVLDRVETYSAETHTGGFIDGRNSTTARFPSYADPKFEALVRGLARQLARFDGNPALSKVRISEGIVTEDNPSPLGLPYGIPGYTDRDWIGYCGRIAKAFRASFHKTQLEFDIDRTAIAGALDDAETRRAADALIDNLIRHRTFLTFDGLSDTTIRSVDGSKPDAVVRQVLQYLRTAKARGDGIGLEAWGALTDDHMQDVAAVAAAIFALKPDRLVLFSDVAASENARREGANAQNLEALSWVRAQPHAAVEATHAHDLLQRLGYE